MARKTSRKKSTVVRSKAHYSFDGDGKRIKKTSATENITFVYDASGQLIEEYSGGAVQPAYVYAGSTILTTETSSGTNYLTADHLGSPRIVTDASGNVTSRKDYTAFGEETVTSQRTTGLGYTPRSIRQDYTGYQKDSESGLEYAQARYYNPLHGRYTSVDPLTTSATIRNPQTFNRYSYVLNSPYKFSDPLGLLPVSIACGQWCQNSDGGGGGYADNYDSGQRSGVEGSILDEYEHWQNYYATHPWKSGNWWAGRLNLGIEAPSQSPAAQQADDSPQTIKFTRISLLDEEGSPIRSKSDCQGMPGDKGCISNEERLSNVWELDVKTDIGPDTSREFFKIKVDFEVVDTKGFEGFNEKASGVSIPTDGRWQLVSVAGKNPIEFAFQGSKGSVIMTLRASRANNESGWQNISVNIRANYSYTDLYKPDTGFERAAPRRASQMIRLYWGPRDGKLRK